MPFHDISPGAWYAPYVRVVFDRNLFSGTSTNTFSPQNGMTRAMFVQVLANLEGVNLTPFSQRHGTFSDTPSGRWYFGAVQWAADQGLVSGVGGGNFAPNRPISRQEMAVMLYNFTRSRGIPLPQGIPAPFTDQGSIASWATDAVHVMQSAGIINGHLDGRFAPQGTATRAEVATIFARFLDVQL